MDIWLLLYNRESNGEHNRQLYLLKSRGMAHSNQVREFLMSSEGIKLRPPYVGPEGVLTGSARLAQEAKDKAAALVRQHEMERRSRESDASGVSLRRRSRSCRPSSPARRQSAALLRREGVAREDQMETAALPWE